MAVVSAAVVSAAAVLVEDGDFLQKVINILMVYKLWKAILLDNLKR